MKAEQLLIKANLDKTVWGERIIQAEVKGKFTPSNKVSALSWTTCACGKLDKLIPRHVEGPPKDSLLRDLGNSFYNYLGQDSFYRTAETLIAIKNRTAKILAELPK